jgi:hypothetical protein
VASFLSAYFLYGSRADEIATSASGRQVLLKDDGTWTYVDRAVLNNNNNASAVDQIRAYCQRQWSDDYEMRAYCERKQKEAVQVLDHGKPSDISEQEFIGVQRRCGSQWPDDFEMRAFCEKKQFEAVRELRGG